MTQEAVAAQYATFVMQDLFFGIDVPCVQEVLQYQHMTPVPLAPKVIEGLINLRGQIVPAIDVGSGSVCRPGPRGGCP